MSATATDHYPEGEPRRRLRSHPLPCPVGGRLLVGEECLRCGCPWAADASCFADCEKPKDLEVGVPAVA